MRIDTEDLRRQYADLTDEALLELDRDDLVEAAQKVYDEEVAKRKLARWQKVQRRAEPEESADAAAEPDLDQDTEGEPDWLDHASCACSFRIPPGAEYSSVALDAQVALRSAGIPCHLTVTEGDPEGADGRAQPLCNAMVPGALLLSATSVLDRDIFNQEYEDGCRTHFESLTDEELRDLDPNILCAGLQGKIDRLKRAYEEELAHRDEGSSEEAG